MDSPEVKAAFASYYREWVEKKKKDPIYWKKRRAAQALWRRNKYHTDPIFRAKCIKENSGPKKIVNLSPKDCQPTVKVL